MNEQDLSEEENIVLEFDHYIPFTAAEIKILNLMWGEPMVWREHNDDTKGDV